MSDSVDDGSVCPYLHPVTGDHLWMYPVAAFCRRPGQPVRVPAPDTLARVCATPSYRACLESSWADDARRST